MQITTILKGLTDSSNTRKSRDRFKTWYREFTKPFTRDLRSFLNANTFEQKGVFECFFAYYNYGIFVRHHGYDIFALDHNDICKSTKNAEFLWHPDSNETEYYWERNWEEVPKGIWDQNKELNLEYFTIKAIIKTMEFINFDKKR